MIFTTLRHVSCFPKITWMFHNGSGKMLFGQLRQTFNFLAKMHKALFRGKTTLYTTPKPLLNCETWWKEHHALQPQGIDQPLKEQ